MQAPAPFHPIILQHADGEDAVNGWCFIAHVPLEELQLFWTGLHHNAPASLWCGLQTWGVVALAFVHPQDGVACKAAHPHIQGKMLWRAAAGRQANPKIAALYKVSNCNGESGCTIVKDSKNKKITCRFGAKWVIPQDDLKTAFIFTRGHHGINF
jgi:hypothetical protein